MSIWNPEDLHRLPPNRSALDLVPESVARASVALPVNWDGSTLEVIVPTDADLDGSSIERLRWAIDVPVQYEFAQTADLLQAIDRAYVVLYSEIRHCDLRLRYRCPRRFIDLSPTDDQAIRNCDVCEQAVYFCRTSAELDTHRRLGRCVAAVTVDEPEEFLGFPDSV